MVSHTRRVIAGAAPLAAALALFLPRVALADMIVPGPWLLLSNPAALIVSIVVIVGCLLFSLVLLRRMARKSAGADVVEPDGTSDGEAPK